MTRRSSSVIVIGLLVVCSGGSTATPSSQAPLVSSHTADDERTGARDDALRRAKVWLKPRVPIEDVRFDLNPSGRHTFSEEEDVVCGFHVEPANGTSPKFECRLKSGHVIKVKYGRDNPEIYAEVAATRLLAALGFPTDRVYVVKRVRCLGCPADPFTALQACWSNGAIRPGCLTADQPSIDFADAVIEERFDAASIEAREIEGWQWHELVKIDPGVAGSSRAEIDALRLMAVFLSHWDNKAENQRLVCLDQTKADTPAPFRCKDPVAMVHDLGGTFGPFKVDLAGWMNTSIWADSVGCRVSMRTLPYEGSTFHDVTISEEGRRFLADRLNKLSLAQIRQLFEGARFSRAPHAGLTPADSMDGWVRAFVQKRQAIGDHPPCPLAAELR